MTAHINGGVWQHYKLGLYRVICRARRESDGEPQVVYQDIGTGRIYTRPESEWLDLIDPKTGEVINDWIGRKGVRRFREINPG